MAVEFICDGCGKRAPGAFNGINHFKPSHWYERTAHETTENGRDRPVAVTVCSRACIEIADKKRGERVSILPF